MSKQIEREVKLAYVKEIIEKRITPTQVANEVGVNVSSVYDWINKYRYDPANALPGSGHQKPDDAGLRKLREENKQLKAEVSFLKNMP